MTIRRHPHVKKVRPAPSDDELSCPVCGLECEDGDEYFIHVQDCESIALEEWEEEIDGQT